MLKYKKKKRYGNLFPRFFTFPVHFFHFHADYVAICVADDHSGSHFHHRATAADLLCYPLLPLQRCRMALPWREDDHRLRRVTGRKVIANN